MLGQISTKVQSNKNACEQETSLLKKNLSLSRLRFMLGGNSAVEPPESMPNSEVKRSSADGSVGFPHVRVGHRQAPIQESPIRKSRAFLRLKKSAREQNQSTTHLEN